MRWLSAACASLKALVIAAILAPAGGQARTADDAAWDAAETAGTAEACQQYLSEFPTGAHADKAFQCVVANAAPAAPQAPAKPSWKRRAQVDIY
jgi:hypothetical protein